MTKLNTAACYHRPDSEFAYLYDAATLHLRLRTAKDDVASVELLCGDPYLLEEQKPDIYPMDKILTTDRHDYWQIAVSAPFKRLAYAFLLEKEIFYGDQGMLALKDQDLQATNEYFRLPYFHEMDRFKAPSWVKETVWYQIFPERFANGDLTNDPPKTLPWASKTPSRTDFFGGDLQGVIDHLDYLQDLGVNGLYFCPIFKAASNHKYDTIDYLTLDPAFGSKQLFKELVSQCHKRGMKVMLDAVFNHLGDHSPQWQDVMKNGSASPYADWFCIHEFPVDFKPTADFEKATAISYDTFAFTPHMPKLNTANPEVQSYLLNIGRYWIEEFDIDAWRLDVANEVDHHFWKRFRQMCEATKTDFYILGEIWHSAQSWLVGDEFHAVMNYAYTDAILKTFVEKKLRPDQLVSRLNEQLMLYRRQTTQMQFNILDSHDTPRLLTQTKEDKSLMKQVMAFTYLQPGVPCLYYGDEVGLTGGADPACRKCMVWDDRQDKNLLAFVKKLIGIRKQHAELLSAGEIKWQVDDRTGMLVLQRKFEEESLVGIFNLGNENLTFDISLAPLLMNLTRFDKDLYQIAPQGFMIYQ